MPEINVIIKAILDDKAFQSGVAGIQSGMGKTGKSSQGTLDKIKEGFLMAAAAVAGYVAVVVNMIKTAEAHARAENNLTTALKAAGEYTKENVKSMKEWADKLSYATGIEEIQIKNLSAMALKQGMNSETAKAATQTAIGLSKALGVDLDSALKMVTQGHNGMFTMIQRSIPSIRTMTDNTQKMAEINRVAAVGLSQLADDMGGEEGAEKRASLGITALKENMGGLIMKGIQPFVTALGKLLAALNQAPAPIRTAVSVLGIMIITIAAVTAATAAFGVTLSAAIWPVTLVVAAVAGLVAVTVEIVDHWTQIKLFFAKMWAETKVIFLFAIEMILKSIETLAGPLIKLIDAVIEGLNKLRGTHTKTLSQTMAEWDAALKDQVKKQAQAYMELERQEKEHAAKKKAAEKTGPKAGGVSTPGAPADPQAEADAQKAALDKYDQYLRHDAGTQRDIENAKYAVLKATAAEYNFSLEKLAKQHSKNMARIKDDEMKQALSGTQEMFRNLSALTGSKNRQMFEIGKAASIAGATVATYESAVKAYDSMAGISPPLGIAAAAAAIAAGIINISKITETKMASFASGSDYLPRDMTARVHEGERIIPRGMNVPGVSNADFMAATMRGMGGGTSTVNNSSAVNINGIAVNATTRTTIGEILNMSDRMGVKPFPRT